MKPLYLLLISLVISLSGARSSGRGPLGPGFGPISPIMEDLTNQQRQEIRQLINDNKNSTKKEIKAAVDGFVAKLPNELKHRVEKRKQRFEERKKRTDQKAKKLSAGAQNLYNEVKVVLEDDSKTFAEDRQLIAKIRKNYDEKVLREFRQKKVFVPGVGPGNGGPLRSIYDKLNKEKRKELNQLLENNREKSKKEGNKALEAFVETLPEKLQEKVQDKKERFEQHKKENDENAEDLSADAKKLYNQVKAAKDDDSLTFGETHDKVRDLLLTADRSVLNEFRQQHIHLFDFGIHAHGGDRSDRPAHRKNNNNDNNDRNDRNEDENNDDDEDESPESPDTKI